MNDRSYSMEQTGALPEKRRSLRETFLSFAVILPVAFLFALKNDLPHVFVITFILLLLRGKCNYDSFTSFPVM